MRDGRTARRPRTPLIQALTGLWFASALGGLAVTLLLAVGPDDALDELRRVAPAVLALGLVAFGGTILTCCQRTAAPPLGLRLAGPIGVRLLRARRGARRLAAAARDAADPDGAVKHFETLFHLLPDAVALIDPSTTTAIEFNERMCDLLGYAPEELRRLPMASYRAFDTPAETAAHLRRILARGSDLVQTVLRTKQGTLRRVICDLRVIDLDGRELLYLVARDVTSLVEASPELRALNATLEERIANRTAQLRAETERARALEAALEQERAFSAGVLEGTPTGILVVGNDGRIRIANRKVQDILGLTEAELTVLPCAALPLRVCDPEGTEIDWCTTALDPVRATGTPLRHQTLRITRPDGENRVVSVNASPILAEGGQVGDVVCCFDDFTRERSLSESLVQAHQRLTALVSALPDLVFILDEHGIYREILGGREDLLYADAAQLLKRNVRDILPASVADPLMEHVLACLADGRPRSFEYDLAVPAGTRHFEARIAPIRQSQEADRTVAVVARDVSTRYAAEQSLLMAKASADEANIAKSRFLATMSHELRTPLNAVLGFTDVLLTKAEGQPDFRRPLEVIQNAGWELLQLIDDILDLSKIEAGKTQLETCAFELSEIVEGTLTLLRPQAEKKALRLSCSVAPELPHILWGDPRRLRQILLNILGNAIKYTEHGHVDLTVARAAGVPEAPGVPILVTVADTGIGIPPEQVDSIFRMFERGNEAYTRTIAGTGMGLTISKRLVEMMGGTIWLDSEPGVGTRFFFTVRLALPPEGNRPSSIPAAGAAIALPDTAQILIVEDDPFSRQLLETILEHERYTLTTAVDGEDALARMQQDVFDLVLMDVQLPGIHGLDLVARIRAGETALPANAPVIATTGFAMAGDRERFLDAGMTDYLSKPVNVQETLSMVRQHLEAASSIKIWPSTATDDAASLRGDRTQAPLP